MACKITHKQYKAFGPIHVLVYSNCTKGTLRPDTGLNIISFKMNFYLYYYIKILVVTSLEFFFKFFIMAILKRNGGHRSEKVEVQRCLVLLAEYVNTVRPRPAKTCQSDRPSYLAGLIVPYTFGYYVPT